MYKGNMYKHICKSCVYRRRCAEPKKRYIYKKRTDVNPGRSRRRILLEFNDYGGFKQSGKLMNIDEYLKAEGVT